MFGVNYKFKIDPVKPDRITLHMTPRTYLDALKPLALVYGGIAVIWFVVTAVADYQDQRTPDFPEIPEED